MPPFWQRLGQAGSAAGRAAAGRLCGPQDRTNRAADGPCHALRSAARRPMRAGSPMHWAHCPIPAEDGSAEEARADRPCRRARQDEKIVPPPRASFPAGRAKAWARARDG